MNSASRIHRIIHSVFACLFLGPPLWCYGFTPHTSLTPFKQTQKVLTTSTQNNYLGSTPLWRSTNRLDKTAIDLAGGGGCDTTGSSIQTMNNSLLLSTEGSVFGGLSVIIILGFAVAVGAFVFANVVYTPEIVQGAQELRQSNRAEEIRKLLQAVRNHLAGGNELTELKVPLETALGTTLEEYVKEVETTAEDDTSSFLTTADRDLVKILKQNI